MPLYELSLIVRSMSKTGLVRTVKRVAENVLDQGGLMRNVECLGTKALPYQMKAHGRQHTNGSYFLLHFDAPSSAAEVISDECRRDIDLCRMHIERVTPPSTFDCTRHDEIKPPAYRSEVQKMIEEANKRVPIHKRKPFKYNTGLDFEPFGH